MQTARYEKWITALLAILFMFSVPIIFIIMCLIGLAYCYSLEKIKGWMYMNGLILFLIVFIIVGVASAVEQYHYYNQVMAE